ncbi:hypothetical protein OAO01_00915 [Oligoflexia bacterium]|nr:hypothetical protein [Oligoflexia bacterium]
MPCYSKLNSISPVLVFAAALLLFSWPNAASARPQLVITSQGVEISAQNVTQFSSDGKYLCYRDQFKQATLGVASPKFEVLGTFLPMHYKRTVRFYRNKIRKVRREQKNTAQGSSAFLALQKKVQRIAKRRARFKDAHKTCLNFGVISPTPAPSPNATASPVATTTSTPGFGPAPTIVPPGSTPEPTVSPVATTPARPTSTSSPAPTGTATTTPTATPVTTIPKPTPIQTPIHTGEYWEFINSSYFKAEDRHVLQDWMSNHLSPERRAEIHKEYRYQALQMVEKYDNPATPLQVVVGYNAQTKQYLYETQYYGDPWNEGDFRTRTNMSTGGYTYGLYQLVQTYKFLKRYYPKDTVTIRFKAWLEKAIEHVFRFGLAKITKNNDVYWEVVGEAQPLGGSEKVSRAAIQADPLKMYPAICWSSGKRVDNWDGDEVRHDVAAMPGALAALQEESLQFNRALVRKGLALISVRYIDLNFGGRMNTGKFALKEVAVGKLRPWQALLNQVSGYLALKDQYPSTAKALRDTALILFDEIAKRGPRPVTGLSSRKYENWISGWNPADWNNTFQDDYPWWGRAFFDSVWAWGVSTMAPGLVYFKGILDPNDTTRRQLANRMIVKTAELFRYRSDMPHMTYDCTDPILDKENNKMHSSSALGAIFGDSIPFAVGQEVMRSFYQPRPGMPKGVSGNGLKPFEYSLTNYSWFLEKDYQLNFGEIFRFYAHEYPGAKAIHLRFLGEFWHPHACTSPYAPLVRYGAGHPKEGQPFCVDDKKKELDCNAPGAKTVERESNTPGKDLVNNIWTSNFKGFNTLHRQNDFGLSTLMFLAGLISGDPAYVDMGLYAYTTRFTNSSGSLTVRKVRDVLDLKHDPVNRRANNVDVKRYQDNPMDWGRAAWWWMPMGILEGWW